MSQATTDSDVTMATASLFAELTSFVSKLSQLNSYGCNANLNFNASAGRIHVAFHTDLGYDHNFSDTPSKKVPKPSRTRRRRKQTFQDSRNISEPFNLNNDENQADALLVLPDENDVDSNECEPSNFSQPSTTLSTQSCDNEDSLNTPAEDNDAAPHSESCSEEEEPWTWSPPREEDMLLYMKENPHHFQKSICVRDLNRSESHERLNNIISASPFNALLNS